MVLPEVGAQGLVKLCSHCPHRIEGVIEGPLGRVPLASVRHTLRRVLEMRHRRRGYGYPGKRGQRRGDRHERGLRRFGPAPVGGSRGGSHPHDGGRLDPSALELGQGLLSVIAPQLGVQWRTHLHLDTQEGHQEAVEPCVAGQGAGGLLAHPEFGRPARGPHGVLHGRGHLEGLTPMVYRHHPGGFGRPAPDDHICLVGGHGTRDPVLGCRLPPRCGLPQEGD